MTHKVWLLPVLHRYCTLHVAASHHLISINLNLLFCFCFFCFHVTEIFHLTRFWEIIRSLHFEKSVQADVFNPNPQQNLTELGLVKLSAGLGARLRHAATSLCTIFPFPGFSMSTSLCSLAPEEKQTPPLPPPSPSSSTSSAGFLLSPLPFAPWAFFYGRASNTWPLPCIRLHVHIHTSNKIKQEQYVIKYERVFESAYCYSNLSLRWVQLPKSLSLPVFSSNNSI